ncbi:hypothetical protein JR316_0009862 [Psilocybe cubensis]|uniref:Uncharacterized protein n=2 Tax=Psilocybe cubensis TaxID=181762 RepID=A0A8H8CER7_PSICU|nr:hypothetical protein JR316_0009862 [Psilocybe cubensis]KAH9477636.1 hypothetical protein JR316_0009862 [Psilocybe cubensis]
MDTSSSSDSFSNLAPNISNLSDPNFNIDLFFNHALSSSTTSNPTPVVAPPANPTNDAASNAVVTPPAAPAVAENTVGPIALPTTVTDGLSFPSLPTIPHPGVRRIAKNRFVFFEPTVGFTEFDAQQAITTKLLSIFCAYDRKLRAQTDPTVALSYIPYGYPTISQLFNLYAVGPERFAFWNDTTRRYVTDGVPITLELFTLPVPRVAQSIHPKPTPTSRNSRALPDVDPTLLNTSHGAGRLFNDMLLLSASAETARRKRNDQYFHQRNFKRRQDPTGAKPRYSRNNRNTPSNNSSASQAGPSNPTLP